jgi:hypothetical protein
MEQTLTAPATGHGHFFDRVLGECEAGHTREAVLMLSGMLDTALGGGIGLAALRREFAGHPLSAMCAAAKAGAGGWNRRLAEAVSRLAFARGLQSRRELGARAIEQAWQGGKRIALIGCGELGELDRLCGQALDNIALEHGDPALAGKLGLAAPAPDQRFDLIAATSLADSTAPAALAKGIARLGERLAPSGSLLLSAFVPGHLGWGWQAVCHGRDLHCHAEPALAAAAAEAGLTITQFRDGSGSLNWAELQKTGALSLARGIA